MIDKIVRIKQAQALFEFVLKSTIYDKHAYMLVIRTSSFCQISNCIGMVERIMKKFCKILQSVFVLIPWYTVSNLKIFVTFPIIPS